MLIPLRIGRRSDGTDVTIDISHSPLTMVSYHNDAQRTALFKQLCKTEHPYADFNYHMVTTREMEDWNFEPHPSRHFIRDEPELGFYKSRQEMMKSILDEMTLRNRILKQQKIELFSRYYALNLWKEEKMSYRLLIVDDIWDLVQHKPVAAGLNLMKILLFGGQVGIHSIIASNISYRNLLQHLIDVHPELTDDLKRKFGYPYPAQLSALGQEIICTPDNLIFYKQAGKMEMEKLYSIQS